MSPRPGVRPVAVAAAFLVSGLVIGYVVGQLRPVLHRAEVTCLTATGDITCSSDPDTFRAEFWVPRDVAWSDAGGALHAGGRPACLASDGRGVSRPVEISWTAVELSGRSWAQAVHVEC